MMSLHTARQSEIAAALTREIATVEDEYRAALQAAARDLQPTKAGTAALEGGVASGPLVELAPDAAMTIHTLEARLDQLKELQQWAKIDPLILRFAEHLPKQRTVPGSSAPFLSEAPVRQRATRRSAIIPVFVGALALAAGWLLSLALPATILLGR
jgi:hypothetical protein